MINKKAFIFDTVAEALAYKIGADAKNTTYRTSFASGATIHTGEPDIPYYSEILIRETSQVWRCNQWWGGTGGGTGGGSGMTDTERQQLQTNTQNIAANAALIRALQQSGIAEGAEYGFTFLEANEIDGLTLDNTTENVLYFGLEEDESLTDTFDQTTGRITATDGTYSQSNGQLTLSRATYNQTTGQLTLA